MKHILVKKKLYSLGLVAIAYSMIVTPLLFSHMQEKQKIQSHAAEKDHVVVAPTSSPQTTVFAITAFVSGVGKASKKAETNANPYHKTLMTNVLLYTRERQLASSGSGLLTYDESQGVYQGNVQIQSTDLHDGTYYVEVRSPHRLSSFTQEPKLITIGETNILSEIKLLAGDIRHDYSVDILDYNAVLDCSQELVDEKTCTQEQKLASDLNDDNQITQSDYSFILKQFATLPLQ